LPDADQLPSREEFLQEIGAILGETEMLAPAEQQMQLFPETQEQTQGKLFLSTWGYVDLKKLKLFYPRLQVVEQIAEQHRFFHWELEFADLFLQRGGFDLMVGNPPWIKIEWQEGDILGDFDPLTIIRNLSASKFAQRREDLFEQYPALKRGYLQEYEESDATQNFLNSVQNYPLLKGLQTNLFKCFLPQAWTFSRSEGVSGFLHPEGVYDDPKGGTLRRELYRHLKAHFQIQNELNLFKEVLHTRRYSINIYQKPSKSSNQIVRFVHIANIFNVKTISDCFESPGNELIPGIKDDNGKWEIKGHPARIISVDLNTLKLFAQLYDSERTPAGEARLSALHSQNLVSVLEKFASQEKRLGNFQSKYYATEMWHETNAEKTDHTIHRNTQFVDYPQKLILSGPHFFVGTPLYKTANEICETHHEYTSIDLTQIPDDYLPRTNYVPDCSPTEYCHRTPCVPWDDKKPVTEFYRLAARKMLSSLGERTYIASIIPPKVAHIHGVQSITFQETDNLLNAVSFGISIIADFYIKTTGLSNLNYTWGNFPFIEASSALQVRTLALNCLTTYYTDLWEDCWQNTFTEDTWTKPEDSRLNVNFFTQLTPQWQRNNTLRTDYERRQALVEIDILAAIVLGLTLDELITIYRVQFPIMQQFEQETYYDMNGRIIFTTNSQGLKGIGLPRKGNAKQNIIGWEDVKDMAEGTVEVTITDDTQPGGPIQRTIVYQAPFEKCDRVSDYRTAWAFFAALGAN
jgi:hypothetical protein